MKTVNKLVRMAVLCLLVLCGSSYFVSCNSSEYDGKEAEQLAEQFYTYYIDNYGNVGNNCEEIASKYLTDDFAKDYISYMKMQYPIDLLSSGTMYEDGKTFFGSFNKAEYIGEDKVSNFIESNKYLSPLFSSIIGLIPNCASSVIITELFVSSRIGIGALLSGLIVNAGLGIFYLLRKDQNKKKVLLIILTIL